MNENFEQVREDARIVAVARIVAGNEFEARFWNDVWNRINDCRHVIDVEAIRYEFDF